MSVCNNRSSPQKKRTALLLAKLCTVRQFRFKKWKIWTILGLDIQSDVSRVFNLDVNILLE